MWKFATTVLYCIYTYLHFITSQTGQWHEHESYCTDIHSWSGTIQYMYTVMLFPADPEGPGPCAFILVIVSSILIMVTIPFSLCFCIKVSGHHSFQPLLLYQGQWSPFLSASASVSWSVVTIPFSLYFCNKVCCIPPPPQPLHLLYPHHPASDSHSGSWLTARPRACTSIIKGTTFSEHLEYCTKLVLITIQRDF